MPLKRHFDRSTRAIVECVCVFSRAIFRLRVVCKSQREVGVEVGVERKKNRKKKKTGFNLKTPSEERR